MVYELTSKKLKDYFLARLNSLKPSQRTSMGLESEISKNNQSVVLVALEKNKSVITPCFVVEEPFNRIELKIKTDTVGVNNKTEVISFLDYMQKDVIFQKGEPFIKDYFVAQLKSEQERRGFELLPYEYLV